MHEITADDAALNDALDRFASHRDPSVRQEIARITDWIAVRSARRFADRGEPFDDLLQVARMGLLKAIDRFDPSFGVPFGAFATPTMIGELRRYFRDHTWSVHVPRRAKDLRPKVVAAVDELSKELGRSPRTSEVAAHLHISDDEVLEAMEANEAYRGRSLDKATSQTTSHEEGYTSVLDREVIVNALDLLQPRQRRILYLRFFEEMSQAQIASEIGTSQVHVGRLIASSLDQLRQRLADSGDIKWA